MKTRSPRVSKSAKQHKRIGYLKAFVFQRTWNTPRVFCCSFNVKHRREDRFLRLSRGRFHGSVELTARSRSAHVALTFRIASTLQRNPIPANAVVLASLPVPVSVLHRPWAGPLFRLHATATEQMDLLFPSNWEALWRDCSSPRIRHVSLYIYIYVYIVSLLGQVKLSLSILIYKGGIFVNVATAKSSTISSSQNSRSFFLQCDWHRRVLVSLRMTSDLFVKRFRETI